MSRHSYRNHCAGKHRHASEGKAQAQLRSLARVSTAQFSVYWCRFCKHWHVGHRPKTQWEKQHGAEPAR